MNRFPSMFPLIRQIMDLGMAVVAGCNTISCLGGQNLVSLAFAVGSTFLWITGLEETTATAAAVIV